MTGFVLHIPGFVLNMTGCVLNFTGFFNMTTFVLNITGFVLNLTGFVLNMTDKTTLDFQKRFRILQRGKIISTLAGLELAISGVGNRRLIH